MSKVYDIVKRIVNEAYNDRRKYIIDLYFRSGIRDKENMAFIHTLVFSDNISSVSISFEAIGYKLKYITIEEIKHRIYSIDDEVMQRYKKELKEMLNVALEYLKENIDKENFEIIELVNMVSRRFIKKNGEYWLELLNKYYKTNKSNDYWVFVNETNGKLSVRAWYKLSREIKVLDIQELDEYEKKLFILSNV